MMMSVQMLSIAFRVDGNKYIGLGHIFRCIHLATYFKHQYGADPIFLILKSSLNPAVLNLLKKESIRYQIVSPEEDPWAENLPTLLRTVTPKRFDVVIVDLLIPDLQDADLTKSNEFRPIDPQLLLADLSRQGVPVVAFSDQFDRISMQADLLINYCPSQKNEWYCSKLGSRYLLGVDYYILAPELRAFSEKANCSQGGKLNVVIFCGGNDHRGFTKIALDELKSFRDALIITVILGAATPDGEHRVSMLRKQGIKAHFNLPELASLFFEADLAITTAGNTLFDLAAIGIPAIALSTRERQMVTARFFSEQGYCYDAGSTEQEVRANLAKIIPEIIDNPEVLSAKARQGKNTVDGNGISRVAEEIVSLAMRGC